MSRIYLLCSKLLNHYKHVLGLFEAYAQLYTLRTCILFVLYIVLYKTLCYMKNLFFNWFLSPRIVKNLGRSTWQCHCESSSDSFNTVLSDWIYRRGQLATASQQRLGNFILASLPSFQHVDHQTEVQVRPINYTQRVILNLTLVSLFELLNVINRTFPKEDDGF